ncbi:hypothetical protein AAZX31_14G053500 [Glycine max]|nr:hypothetical protein GYH30_039102 [Glycine max]
MQSMHYPYSLECYIYVCVIYLCVFWHFNFLTKFHWMAAKKYFVTVFKPEEHSESMLIPDAFVKSTRLQGWRIPEDVILTNVGRRVWNVKTRLVGNKIYFEEGWKVFQEENFLGKEDYLVFKYDGANIFKVVILEQSSRCERTEAEEEDEVIEITDDEEHEEAEDDEDEGDDDDQYREMEEEHSAEYMRSQSHPRRASKRLSATSYSPTVEGPHLEDYEFDPQMYIQPGNPNFEAKLFKNRPNELHVPKNVIKDSSLTFGEQITLSRCQCFQLEDTQRDELRDYHGLPQWTPIYSEVAKVSEWRDGRVCIKGWTSFCKKNKINKNDACICEIISGEDRIIRTIQVHVLGARNG